MCFTRSIKLLKHNFFSLETNFKIRLVTLYLYFRNWHIYKDLDELWPKKKKRFISYKIHYKWILLENMIIIMSSLFILYLLYKSIFNIKYLIKMIQSLELNIENNTINRHTFYCSLFLIVCIAFQNVNIIIMTFPIKLTTKL